MQTTNTHTATGKSKRPLSAEEVSLIKRMQTEGFSAYRISKLARRRPETVRQAIEGTLACNTPADVAIKLQEEIERLESIGELVWNGSFSKQDHCWVPNAATIKAYAAVCRLVRESVRGCGEPSQIGVTAERPIGDSKRRKIGGISWMMS